MLSRRLAGALGVACLLTALSPPSGLASPLPAVTSGVRPGPAILYAPPAIAPQLTNAPGSAWNAPPILISGAHEYHDGPTGQCTNGAHGWSCDCPAYVTRTVETGT